MFVEGVELGETTVKLTALLVIPSRVAVILPFPIAMPVATPVKETTIPVLLLSHVTLSVMSAVEPFEYLPVAVNCRVEPTVMLGGDTGITIMEESFVEHAGKPIIKITDNPIIAL